MLVSLHNHYFPEDDVVLINLENAEETPVKSILGLLAATITGGARIEFVTAMSEARFDEWVGIISALSYTPTKDVSGLPDADYTPCQPVSACEGDCRLLLARLRSEAVVPGRKPVFSPLAPNPIPTQSQLETTLAPTKDKPQSERVFISYSYSDLAFVENTLLPILEQARLEPWFSVDSIRGADRWERSILDGLQTSNWFLVVMSPHAAKSEWVHLEVHWASEHRQGKIVPIMIADCDPWQMHMRLGSIQYIDFRTNFHAARSRLLSAFGRIQKAD